MKLQNVLLTLFAATALLFSCKEEEPDPELPKLEVAQSELSFEQTGGTATLNVTSNRPWTISTDADWLAFSPSGGAASANPVSVTVTALANSSNDRTSSFKVKTDFDFRTVNVSQKGAKGEDTTDKPSGDGTKDKPYNPAGVVAYINTLAADTESPDVVYVTGKVSEVKTTYEASGNYGNATFYMSEDGSKTLTQFYVYQTYYLGNKKWKSGQTDIKVGDEVTVCGKVVNYNGKIPETVGKGGSYVCTLNGTTEYGSQGGSDKPEAKGAGTLEDPYNPSAAADAVAGLTWTSNTEYQTTGEVYVKGKISKIANKGTFTDGGTYGNASFYIVEEGTDFEFYVFRTLYLGNKKFESGQTDIKVGDEVIIHGKLMNYQGKTPETEANNSYIYSLNGVTGGEEPGPGPDATDATVAQALTAENDALLNVGPALVVASSSNGFLMEQDGARIYVYKKTASVGDMVTVKATKTEYGGAPQLSDPTVTTVSSGNEVTYPEPKDITAAFDSYASDTREYVTYKGTLAISGNYVNVNVEGATVTGSVLKPVNDISSLDGKAVTITGYYLYHTTTKTGVKYLYVIATKVEGEGGETPGPGPGGDESGDGTLTNPYTPAAAAGAAANLTWTSNTEYQTTGEVYVKGKICKIANKGTFTEGGSYGNASFYISADGQGDGEFYVFRTLYLGNQKFAEGQTDIKVGDEVIIFGKLMNYQGKTPETEANKSYIFSLNGTTENTGGGEDPGPGGDTTEGSITWSSANSWTGVADAAETISFTSGTITITAKKESASTKPTVNGTYNDCRVYAKGTLTVTTTGDAMTSIVFNISSQGQKRLTTITANTGTVAKQGKGDKTVTWTGSAKSVTFTVGEKAVYGSDGDTKAGQFDFSSVVIK